MSISICLILFIIITKCMCDSISISPFTHEVLCDVADRVSRKCSQKETTRLGGRSIVECMAICGLNTACIGASLDDRHECFLHYKCPALTSCLTEDKNHRYMARYCIHGTWNPISHSCDCSDYVSGARCNQFLQSCKDLIVPGHVFGEHKVLLDPDADKKNPVSVVCRTRSPNHSAILVMRNEGKISFNRSWDEYKRGFYVDFYNLWAGHDSLHHLTTSGCKRMVASVTFHGHPISRLKRDYDDFLVGNETTGYAFSFSSSTPSSKGPTPAGSFFGDCLSSLRNTPFSTWDRDNDGENATNCASWAGSAWWYSGCHNPCNLLGYGYDYWFSKASQELFSLEGLDVDAHASNIWQFTMLLRCN